MTISNKIIERFWKKVDIKSENECWNWKAYTNKDGYGQFNYDGLMRLAHRISYLINIGEIKIDGIEKEKVYICHHCDNSSCVNPNHLFIGTQKENMMDMNKKGRTYIPNLRGSKHGQSKLNEEQVIDIKNRLANGELYDNIAKDYNVTNSNIHCIASEVLWGHIKIDREIKLQKKYRIYKKQRKIIDLLDKLDYGKHNLVYYYKDLRYFNLTSMASSLKQLVNKNVINGIIVNKGTKKGTKKGVIIEKIKDYEKNLIKYIDK